MKMKHLLTLAALAFAFAAPAAHALDWSDNAFHYWWGPNFREPGVSTSYSAAGFPEGSGKNISKNVVTFTHVDGYKLGQNFLTIDLLISNSVDSTNQNTSQGATEVYAIYRHDLSLNKVSGSKTFELGPVRDLFIEAGVDMNTKNTAFAPHKAMPVVGPAIALNVPGFWKVAVLLNKEWNNNGIVGKSVVFDPTVMFATAWGVPLGTLPLEFEGFASVNLPKGKDGFGNNTKTEVLLHPKLMWDVGPLWSSKGYQLGAGFQYWLNKFGNDADATPGARERSVFFEAAVHL
jgi:hypothetical protein